MIVLDGVQVVAAHSQLGVRSMPSLSLSNGVTVSTGVTRPAKSESGVVVVNQRCGGSPACGVVRDTERPRVTRDTSVQPTGFSVSSAMGCRGMRGRSWIACSSSWGAPCSVVASVAVLEAVSVSTLSASRWSLRCVSRDSFAVVSDVLVSRIMEQGPEPSRASRSRGD